MRMIGGFSLFGGFGLHQVDLRKEIDLGFVKSHPQVVPGESPCRARSASRSIMSFVIEARS